MQKVTSRDGVNIAFERAGSGPPLIVIGGSLADHHFYQALAGAFSAHFTVYNYDRRGRGQSSDAPVYAVEREVEDVAALIAHAGQSVYLYGHSAGSALALRAAAARLDVVGLVLADPPFSPHSDDDEDVRAEFKAQEARIQNLSVAGDHRGSAQFFLSGFGMSAHEIDGILDSPAGMGMIACARALPYDYALLGDGLTPVDLASTVNAPTLIVAPEAAPFAARELARVIPKARLRLMNGFVYETPPAQLAEIVKEALL